MKLIVAIVQDQDSHILIDELMENDFRITKLASTGGFLKSGNTTLLIGLEDDRIPKALEIIESNCKVREMTTSLMTMNMPGDGYMPYPVTVKVGGANIFILDIEEYVHF
ncbi:MAG: hypothetical protein GXZ08_03180 [Tissierellia bacterium]|nr:hypothetical protein [Tissierellia bacterium]